eukprot:1526801-Amphidinium_carterae.1
MMQSFLQHVLWKGGLLKISHRLRNVLAQCTRALLVVFLAHRVCPKGVANVAHSAFFGPLGCPRPPVLTRAIGAMWKRYP